MLPAVGDRCGQGDLLENAGRVNCRSRSTVTASSGDDAEECSRTGSD